MKIIAVTRINKACYSVTGLTAPLTFDTDCAKATIVMGIVGAFPTCYVNFNW